MGVTPVSTTPAEGRNPGISCLAAVATGAGSRGDDGARGKPSSRGVRQWA